MTEFKPGDVLEFTYPDASRNRRRMNRVVLAVEGDFVWVRNDSPTCAQAYRVGMTEAKRAFRKAVEGRTGELEQLCRDMYGQMDYCGGAANHACMRIYRDRMDALGLLEVSE